MVLQGSRSGPVSGLVLTLVMHLTASVCFACIVAVWLCLPVSDSFSVLVSVSLERSTGLVIDAVMINNAAIIAEIASLPDARLIGDARDTVDDLPTILALSYIEARDLLLSVIKLTR